MGFRKDGYKERCLEQLQNWVEGKSIHNKIDDECCPDFSCCNNVSETPLETRKIFKAAYEQENWDIHESLCYSFLANAFADKKVFICNGKDEITTQFN